MDRKLKTVLVVDDSGLIRKVVRKLLEEEHYHTLEAENGLEALKVLRREKADLIVSDLNMPEMDGLGLLKMVRTSSEGRMNPDVPFIILTSHSEKERIISAGVVGVNTWILKEALKEKLVDQAKALCPPFS